MKAVKWLTWEQALFSFRFVNNIPTGKAKRKESLIATFYETSPAHLFDWLAFADSANQNYLRTLQYFSYVGKRGSSFYLLSNEKSNTKQSAQPHLNIVIVTLIKTNFIKTKWNKTNFIFI